MPEDTALPFAIGRSCVTKFGAYAATPTMPSKVFPARDMNLDLGANEYDVTDRKSKGFDDLVATSSKLEISGSMIYDPTSTDFKELEALAIAKTPFLIAFMDDRGNGLLFAGCFFGWKWGQPCKEGNVIEFTIKKTRSAFGIRRIVNNTITETGGLD